MANKKRIQKAIKDGEVLTIIYQGGSQPGSKREIKPIKIIESKLRARCMSSEAVKSFLISKISIIDKNEELDTPDWKNKDKQIDHYESIESLLEKKQDYFVALGWHVEQNPNMLSLHSRFKNGKVKKGADVLLSFEEFDYAVFVDDDGEVHSEDPVKRQRPWVISAKSKDTRTYGSFDNAVHTFLEWAQSLAPV